MTGDGGGWLGEEPFDGAPECVGEPGEFERIELALAELYSGDRRPIKADALGELTLGEAGSWRAVATRVPTSAQLLNRTRAMSMPLYEALLSHLITVASAGTRAERSSRICRAASLQSEDCPGYWAMYVSAQRGESVPPGRLA